MPYRTFAEVVNEAGGQKRYHEDVETGRAETEESHPFFDLKAAEADSIIDAELKRAGYVVPLQTPLADGRLANIALGIYFGLLSQTSSKEQSWITELAKTAKEDLRRIGDGATLVIGAVVDETDAAGGDIFGSEDSNPVFEFGDPYSQANDVFASLGPGPRRWR